MVCGEADCCATGIDGGETRIRGAGLMDVAPPVSLSRCPLMTPCISSVFDSHLRAPPSMRFRYTMVENTDSKSVANTGQYSLSATRILNTYHLILDLHKRARSIPLTDWFHLHDKMHVNYIPA